MSRHELVLTVIGRIRPFIQLDGGDVELVSLEGDTASIRMTGRCATCPSAEMTLHAGLETTLRRVLPTLRVLRVE